jgi:U3 small nucleolar RNA-associated protein MPP10
LAKQIAELEGQAIGPKDWTLLGEASSRARPENSLLEEDLDFEQVGKVVPVEEMIKKRIIDVSGRCIIGSFLWRGRSFPC